jgi:hypothetical protein
VCLRVIHNSRSYRELEAEIFRAYTLLEVFFTSPKFCLKSPSGLRALDSSWRGLTHDCASARVLETGRTVRPSPTDGLCI